MSLGLNFAVTQKTITKQNIIAEVEKGIQKIPNASANIIRGKIVNTLNQSNTHQPNLTSEQRKALQVLIKRDDLVITRADKSNCTVILDKSDYKEKMHKILNDNSIYMLLKHDLTGNIEKKLNKYVYQLFKNKAYLKMSITIFIVQMLMLPEFMVYQKFTNLTRRFDR